jgi:hypothetical protein
MPVKKKKGAVKKKGATKKAKPNGKGLAAAQAEVSNGLASVKAKLGAKVQVRTVETLAEDVGVSLLGVQEFIESIEPGVIFPQKLLEFGVILENLGKAVTTTRKAFDAKALEHKAGEGSFEHGIVAITFPETERRSPKWKDEATDRARQLAEAAGEDFDPKKFAKEVTETYPVTVSRKVKLTVSE